MKRSLLVVGILAGYCALSGSEAGGRLTLALKGGLSSPRSGTFNNEIVPSVNLSIQDFLSQAAAFGFDTKSDELEKIGLGPMAGCEIEWFFRPRISLAAGVEYFKRAPSASSRASGSEGAAVYDLTQNYDIKASVIPVLATVRYHLPLGKFRAYAGAGAGYYWGSLGFNVNFDLKVNGVSAGSDMTVTEGTGRAVVPHLNAGLDFSLMKRISLAADVRYSFGKIKSFKINRQTDNDLVGRNITYINAQGDEKTVMWELDGFTAGLMIKIRF